jgi:hypothetical protein
LTNETTAQVRIDQIVHTYKELGDIIRQAESQREKLREQIVEWMGEEDALDIEGLPTLRRKQRSRGIFWDSSAITRLQVERPHEWERIVDLGGVRLDLKVLRLAVEKGQLMGLPAGGVEQSHEVLEFDRK